MFGEEIFLAKDTIKAFTAIMTMPGKLIVLKKSTLLMYIKQNKAPWQALLE
jgi:hypothetical protein